MKIVINGEDADIACDSLQELLTELSHEQGSVATAVNQVFVSVADRGTTMLADGDRVEIIAPMAGG